MAIEILEQPNVSDLAVSAVFDRDERITCLRSLGKGGSSRRKKLPFATCFCS